MEIDMVALWERFIERITWDLLYHNDEICLIAAKYFFSKPGKNDAGDIRTFTGLCDFLNINSDWKAEQIFKELNTQQQARILALLKKDGYDVPFQAAA